MNLKKMIAAFDAVYLKDEATWTFCAVKLFVKFCRESEQSFSKFLTELTTDTEWWKNTNYHLKIVFMAYFLLVVANLLDELEWLVRAKASLEFNEIKNKIHRIFGKYDGREGFNVWFGFLVLHSGMYHVTSSIAEHKRHRVS